MYDPFGKSVNNDEFRQELSGSSPAGPAAEPEASPAQPAEAPVGTEYHHSRSPEEREVTRIAEEPWTTGVPSAPENTAVPPRPVRTKTRTKKEKKTGLTAGRVIALLLCCALIGGAAGVGGAALMNGSRNGSGWLPSGTRESVVYEGERESTVLSVSKIDTSRLMTAAEVYAANVNSTVGITTSITTNYFGYQSTAAASGSGFIITSDGYIVTNYHVIENSNSITVTLYDGTAYEATVVGYDESNDLAVLKVEAAGLTPVVLGDSDNLNVGDSVLAIGNPLGELTFSRRPARSAP